MESILIIDDEADIRDILAYNLKREGFEVFTASNGPEGIDLATQHKPNIIILDVMMPEMDGIEVCEILRGRKETQHIKICFLTARSEDYSQIAGFEAGADDYVSKPIKPKVLISRLKAILRRSVETKKETASIESKELIIDRDKYIITIHGESIHLPKKEFELLALLASKPERVFDRDYILETVWGTGIVVGDRTIDVHIRRLREKIGNEYIRTIKGVGYKYIDKK
ncbi:MAG: response regulator transcription factor [Crocinitomicaceae bacterium]|nr:response regulator transcription factor [Crocinitomicaceae bacterium]